MPPLIRDATLTDHRGSRRADIYTEDGLIKKIGAGLYCPGAEVIDAEGLYVLPAFVDLHAHLRDPGFTYKEDIYSGTRAAAKGGYTTLNAMANTKPVCSSPDMARDVSLRAAEAGYCDVYQTISLTDGFGGESSGHLDDLAEDPEKRFVKFVSEDGFGVRNSYVFWTALNKCAKYGRAVLVHAEDADFRADMYAAEDLETLRDLYLAEKSGARVHFCHVSTEFSARAITAAAATERGARVSFEITPHHIALNDECVFRVNPPLRRESDRRYLIEAVRNNQAFAIATDHAPHGAEDKENGAPGLVGLETAFSVCYTTLVREEGIALETLSRLMSKNPALFMEINKGELTEGYIADLVIADLDKKVVIDGANFLSKSRNTPFEGKTYYGEIIRTIKNGRVLRWD